MTIPYPRISPELVRIGPFALRWYAVMYIIGYAVGIAIAKRRVRRGMVPFDESVIDSLVGYLVVGMFLGARVVYVWSTTAPTTPLIRSTRSPSGTADSRFMARCWA